MKKILIVVDMQNDFITGPLGNPECQATVPKIVELIKNNTYDQIILTKDTHFDNYMDTQEGKNLPVPHCIKGTDGWEIVDEITNVLATKQNIPQSIVEKPTFGSTKLSETLSDIAKNDTDITIDFVGVCTGICVISNAMIAKATLPEAPITVIKDCCACVTPESHQTALDAMKLCQIAIQ